jgi:hypothetical protein
VTTRIRETETGEGGTSALAAVARSPVAWTIDIDICWPVRCRLRHEHDSAASAERARTKVRRP